MSRVFDGLADDGFLITLDEIEEADDDDLEDLDDLDGDDDSIDEDL